MKIFISYSREDASKLANQIHNYLTQFGQEVFTDVTNIQKGDPWNQTIEKNISQCYIFVVILTPDSLRSPSIQDEVEQAQRENKIIIPCINPRYVGSNEIKWNLGKYQGIEFTELEDLKMELYNSIRQIEEGSGKGQHLEPPPAVRPPAVRPPAVRPRDRGGWPKDSSFNIRKSIGNFSPAELANLRTAYSMMMAINNKHGYRYLAGIHGIPNFGSKYGTSGLFLPWNRAYIYNFELYLQDAALDHKVSVPWWDWTSQSSQSEGIPKAFSEAVVDGKPNPLYQCQVVLTDESDIKSFTQLTKCRKSKVYNTQRDPGSPTCLPASQEIKSILSITDYTEFSDQLEDQNNRVQIWIGGKCGDMSYVPFASYDPIFWSHRVMIDRIFWLWQKDAKVPERLHDEILDPFNLTVNDVLNIQQLGYDYASQQSLIGG